MAEGDIKDMKGMTGGIKDKRWQRVILQTRRDGRGWYQRQEEIAEGDIKDRERWQRVILKTRMQLPAGSGHLHVFCHLYQRHSVDQSAT